MKQKTLTVRQAIEAFPKLLDEPVAAGQWDNDNLILSTEITFQFVGDNNYRTSLLTRSFKKGDIVKAKRDLKSDDRESGIEDGTPIVVAGAFGKVVEPSFSEEMVAKSLWVVDWGFVKFDTDESEMEKV